MQSSVFLRHLRQTMRTIIVALIVALCTYHVAAQCTDAQPTVSTNYFQSGSCTAETPFCVYRGPLVSENRCAQCGIGGETSEPGGGSCQCDARTQYCSQTGVSAGTCATYTKINMTCSKDSDCQTKGYVITSIYPTVTTVYTIDEYLFCVGSKCKPCRPTDWIRLVGPLGTPHTCAGYDSALSNRLGRYADRTSRPAYNYTCLNSGDLVVFNAAVNYDYGYGTNRSLWVANPTTTAATLSSTATRTMSGTSSNVNSPASAVQLTLALLVGAAAIFT